jgi:hypothetical protein
MADRRRHVWPRCLIGGLVAAAKSADPAAKGT